MTEARRWEFGSIVAVQTGREPNPIRVVRVNGRLWNNGRIWDDDTGSESPDALLNQLGAEGWDLVNVVTALDGWNDGTQQAPPTHVGRTFIYYLKRLRP